MWSDKFVGHSRIKIFCKASFFSIFTTSHIVFLLFVYLETYFLFIHNYMNIFFVYLVTRLFYYYTTDVSC